MQGMKRFISTEDKASYLNNLLKLGFDTLDFGSFVSPKAVPQMKDTEQVLKRLHLSETNTKLLAIVANTRGAMAALSNVEIDYLGFPLSVSPSFQKRNTNQTIEQAFLELEDIQSLCIRYDRTLVVYLSMAFGNPYGDNYATDIIHDYISKLDALEVSIVSLADTVGTAKVSQIELLGSSVIHAYPHLEFGMHLHSSPLGSEEKIKAVMKAGCERIDGALLGMGGCPFATDDLVGNLDTLKILDVLGSNGGMVDSRIMSEVVAQANRLFIDQ